MNSSQASPTPGTTSTPRARRGAAAVFAQYIQDLTHPSDGPVGTDPRVAAA